MTEEKTATCKNCGHTWKPRNTSTPNHKRKCGKCGSEDIELKTAESPAPENEQPTQQEIKDLIKFRSSSSHPTIPLPNPNILSGAGACWNNYTVSLEIF